LLLRAFTFAFIRYVTAPPFVWLTFALRLLRFALFERLRLIVVSRSRCLRFALRCLRFVVTVVIFALCHPFAFSRFALILRCFVRLRLIRCCLPVYVCVVRCLRCRFVRLQFGCCYVTILRFVVTFARYAFPFVLRWRCSHLLLLVVVVAFSRCCVTFSRTFVTFVCCVVAPCCLYDLRCLPLRLLRYWWVVTFVYVTRTRLFAFCCCPLPYVTFFLHCVFALLHVPLVLAIHTAFGSRLFCWTRLLVWFAFAFRGLRYSTFDVAHVFYFTSRSRFIWLDLLFCVAHCCSPSFYYAYALAFAFSCYGLVYYPHITGVCCLRFGLRLRSLVTHARSSICFHGLRLPFAFTVCDTFVLYVSINSVPLYVAAFRFAFGLPAFAHALHVPAHWFV